MDTEVIKITESHLSDSVSELARAADIIKSGGLVVFPTETVYGLGADATNPEAARKTYEAKGRPSDNPLIIHVAKASDAEKYAYTTDLYYRLANRFMPGPLTVILKAKETVPLATRGGLDTVAVRCPSNKIANKLIELSGVAVSAPSANISGSPSATNASHVIDDMMGRVEMIIDGGDCDFGLESTIVKIDGESSVTLLRPGKITVSELSEVAREVKVADAVTGELKEGEVALSPGMKYKHYAPKSDVILLDADTSSVIEYIKNSNKGKIALISYREDVEILKNSLPDAFIYDFGNKSDEIGQAHELFFILRDIDKKSFDTVYAPLPKKEGISLAIYNRIVRAAAHKIIKL